jgi:hypothetical protein
VVQCHDHVSFRAFQGVRRLSLLSLVARSAPERLLQFYVVMGIAFRHLMPPTCALVAAAAAVHAGCFDSDDTVNTIEFDNGSGSGGSTKAECSFDPTGVDTGTTTECAFNSSGSYVGTSSPLTVNIDTSSPHAVAKNFVGANSELTATAMDWGNTKYASAVKSLGLSWVRYSAGTLSDAYDWQNGTFPADWGSQFPGGKWDETACLWNARSGCGAKWGSEEMYSHWDIINQAKTGKMQLPSWVNFAKAADVETFVDVNVFTDTAKNAKKLATQLQAANIPIALFEMGNEEYLYTFNGEHKRDPKVDGGWLNKPASWDPAGGENFFGPTTDGRTPVTAGANYLNHVEPYAKAIKEIYPDAHISVSVSGGNSSWEKEIADWTQTHEPFFDTLDAHIYGADGDCPFVQNAKGSDAGSNSTEECMNYALATTANDYPTALLTHPGCGTASGCGDKEGKWRDGFSPRIVYSELNADLEGGDGAQVVIPDNTRRGTMFNAVFLSEYVARTASCTSADNCSVDHVVSTGVQYVYGNWFGLLNSTYDTPLRYDLLHGNPNKVDTETHDYQIFLTAPGLAFQVLTGAIPRGVGVNSLATTVASDNAPTVRACSSQVVGAEFGIDGCDHRPAINAFTFAEPGTNRYHTLVFNRGEHNANIDLQINGKAIHPTDSPVVTYLYSDNPQAGNTVVSAVPGNSEIPYATECVPNVELHSCKLSASCDGNGECEGGSHYQVLPWSVARIDWTESSLSSGGGGGSSGTGSGVPSSDCNTKDLSDFNGLITNVGSGTCVDTSDATYECLDGTWKNIIELPAGTCTGG